MNRRSVFFCVMVALAIGSRSDAAILWDYSPSFYDVTGKTWVNKASQQNFAERIVFNADVLITGMDIYSGYTVPVGTSATIRLWDDASTIPGNLLQSFTQAITIIDTDGATTGLTRKHVDFSTPIVLTASTVYWIGMSGTDQEIGQASIDASATSGNRRMAQFNGTAYSYSTLVGDMAFRLWGVVIVPEPSTLAVWSILGLTGIIFVGRRRRMMRT